MGESRQELLAWANSLLQLNLTKVEQFGTGAPYCQIYDSIFLDLPMSRVKFNVNSEWQYLENFKILSSAFRKHQIERSIPVESLVKCKMQDNLEFLQWTKRFWDQYFPGGDYDALSRRKGSGAPASSASAGMRASTTKRPAATTSTTRAARPAAAAGAGAASGAAVAKLQQENNALTETVAGLERERDFYFSKLRDIELLVQGAFEAEPELENEEGGLLKQIQNILYSTEEGFEIPAETEEDGAGVAEEETF
ncbi:microtubule integrity protein mal3 [Elsinoe australis]|uniref:Microtubule integrity protein mal3 n=1 Tax=Elsinoe australis TaxID=40998 RepID=A0A4U7ALD1_9PEZI|nr:microtubule integrity protein mal3 [Elsinoe australis]